MKRIGLVFIFILLIATTAMSSETMQSSGPFKASTVAEAKVAGVDTNVVLSGHVIKKIQANKFLFSDGTGELIISADNDLFSNISMTNDKVEITGLISQNFMYTEVDATAVVVLQ